MTYRERWLEWLRLDSNQRWLDTQTQNGVTYLEIVTHLLLICKDDNIIKSFYEEDVRRKHRVDVITKKVLEDEKRILMGCETELNYAFITIGYNDDTITIDAMKSIIEKIKGLPCWLDFIYVHEKHRHTGIHHHTHILAKFDRTLYKSKIIQYIWQIKNIKKYVLSKPFIDVRMNDGISYQNRLKYINGDKQESKLKYIELDRQWRKENNL